METKITDAESLLRKLSEAGNVAIWHGTRYNGKPIAVISQMDVDGNEVIEEIGKGETIEEAIREL